MQRAACVLLALAGPAAGTAPHVLFMLVDDLGYNDIGYHQDAVTPANPTGAATTNHPVDTPFLDGLAAQGVKLESYYVENLCVPARSALMTGRYPSHTGMSHSFQHTYPYGVPAKETLMPELFHASGYRTYMVGKWDLGFCQEEYTPTFRGFENFFGLLYHGRGTYWGGQEYPDLRNATDSLNAMAPLSAQPEGTYSLDMFVDEAGRYIQKHVADHPGDPMFLYFAPQGGVLGAPESYLDLYRPTMPNTTLYEEGRLIKAAMLKCLDDGLEDLLGRLQTAGLYDDTVVVFSTDNGGGYHWHHSGNNYPLRGWKQTFWEGGVRGVGFIKGTASGLAPLPAGATYRSLMHLTDWLPTLVEGAAGVPTAGRTLPLDGFNHWPHLQAGSQGPRNTVVNGAGWSARAGAGLRGGLNYTVDGGAVRVGNFKMQFGGITDLAWGYPKELGYRPRDMLREDVAQKPPPGMAAAATTPTPAAFSYNGADVWLFDIAGDPTESHNLAAARPDVLTDIVKHFLAYQDTTATDLEKIQIRDVTAKASRRPCKCWEPFNTTCWAAVDSLWPAPAPPACTAEYLECGGGRPACCGGATCQPLSWDANISFCMPPATNVSNATNTTNASNATNVSNATHTTNVSNATHTTNASNATDASNATNASKTTQRAGDADDGSTFPSPRGLWVGVGVGLGLGGAAVVAAVGAAVVWSRRDAGVPLDEFLEDFDLQADAEELVPPSPRCPSDQQDVLHPQTHQHASPSEQSWTPRACASPTALSEMSWTPRGRASPAAPFEGSCTPRACGTPRGQRLSM